MACWRWSDTSEAEARSEAAAAAKRVAAAFASGKSPSRYGYADRPLREPVLEEFRDRTGGLAGVMTCNAYGATVLNTARAMFVDIDIPALEEETAKPAGESAAGGLLSRLFGKSKPGPALRPHPVAAGASTAEAAAVVRVEQWTAGKPGWSWRVYRTAAGLRLLATHRSFEPQSAETALVFEELGADPLYRRLCHLQQSFRARLTPKPWRLGGDGLGRPPPWPWANDRVAREFDQWHSRYSAASRPYATCRLFKTVGSGVIDAELQQLVQVHDEHTRVATSLPLA